MSIGVLIKKSAPLLVGLSLLAPASAGAQPSDDVTAAQVLYDNATALMDDDRPAEACPKLEKVTQLIPDGLGAKLTLADCYERIGRLASAWELYWATATLAAKTNQVERQVRASYKALTLRPRLATISLQMSDRVKKLEGLTVKKDGVVIDPSLWGEKIPIDIGDHVIDVDASNQGAWSQEVHVDRDGVDKSVTLEPETGPPPARRSWQRPLGYTLGGVGLGTLVTGFALGGVAMAKASSAGKECDASLSCNQQGLEDRKTGRSFADAATAFLVIGAVATATSVVVVLTSPKSKAPKTQVAVSPGFVSLAGEF